MGIFSKHLYSMRMNSAFTQKEMAAILRISPTYLHDLEKGRRLPSIRVADALAQLEHDLYPQGHSLNECEEFWHEHAARTHGWKLRKGEVL
jgi:DNA-binding XRE family transcriptional regulator